MRNALLGSQRIRSARKPASRSRNSPNSAEPLPVIMAVEAPARISRFLRAARRRCCSKTTASKSLRRPLATPLPHTCDWKLNILFCCDSLVKRGLRRRYASAVRNVHAGRHQHAGCGGPSGSGNSSVPRPIPTAVPPSRKNGTSLPSCCASSHQLRQIERAARPAPAAPAAPPPHPTIRRPAPRPWECAS